MFTQKEKDALDRWLTTPPEDFVYCPYCDVKIDPDLCGEEVPEYGDGTVGVILYTCPSEYCKRQWAELI